MTSLTVEIIPDPELSGFTARVPDIPAYGEGNKEEEAIADLREALAAYIEAFGIDDGSKTLRIGILRGILRDIEMSPLLRS